jgi:two-component system, LytTR family, response regulator
MIQSIKTIVVDNDSSRENLTRIIREHCPVIEILAECNSLKTAWQSVAQVNPQLVFLGVELADGNGFDLLRMFRNIPFKFIIIALSRDYAVEAFRFSATDYLIKPVQIAELMEAVVKVQRDLILVNTIQEALIINRDGARPVELNQTLVISNTKGFTVTKTDDIILCEAGGYSTNFYLTGNHRISSSHNLKYYETLLPADRFMRVHNSYIINKEHVTGYTFQKEILLSENLKCSLSAGHKTAFLDAFRKLK